MAKRNAAVATKIIDSLKEFTEALEAMPDAATSHYIEGGVEAIDVIEAFNLGFSLGNVVKYILRHGRKNPIDDLTDLRKARWYLDREIRLHTKAAVEACSLACQEHNKKLEAKK